MSNVPKALQVYIIEDSPILLSLFVAETQAAGAVVIGSSDDAQRAIAELSHLQPDLILTDIALTSGTAFDVLRALQAGGLARTAIKVVITNYATTEYREESFRLGAAHFFDKSTEGWLAIDLIKQMAAARRSPGASADPEWREPNNHH